MTPWHLGMLLAFDLETTGPEPADALIVTACVSHVDGSGVIPPGTETWLSDVGGKEIPAEAANIHGITTERARADGKPAREVVSGVAETILRSVRAGLPVVAFVASYDLTVLDRETRRHSLPPFGDAFEAAGGTVIDPYVLDKALDTYRRGSRSLSAACQHYGVRLDCAHDAAADAIAAARVAWKIAQRFPSVATMPLADLHAMQVRAKAQQARSFQEYQAKQGKTEVIDGSWPLRPWMGEAA